MEVIEIHLGVWKPTFWVASGPDFRPVSYAEYERLRKAGACGSDSHYGQWPTPDHELELICEI